MFKQIFSPALLSFWLFIAFALGIVLGLYLHSFLTFLLLFLFLIILAVIFYKRQEFLLSDIFIIILFISLGALWYLPHTYKNIDDFIGEENNFVLQITSLPKENISKNLLLAETRKINGIKIAQRIRIIDYTKKMTYLNSYEVIGKLNKIQFKNNDFYTLWVKSKNIPKILPANIWDKFTCRTTYRLLDILKSNLSNESYRFLASVFLGRRELLNNKEKDIFTNAGISHLLAISGSNIGLSALVLFFILKLFNINFRPRLIVSVIFLCVYTVITGVTSPTLRATMMYFVFSLSFFMKRKLNPFNSLGICGLICLLLKPQWIFDVGFQLSFLSIFALILGFRLFPLKASGSGFINNIKYLFFSSLYVNVLILPLISFYFERIYILNIINNMILIPFFTLILIINFLLIIFSPLKFISGAIGGVISLMVPLFYKISAFLGSLKLAFVTFHFNSYAVFTYYIFLGVVLLLLFRQGYYYSRKYNNLQSV